jgi:hypothetical protein
MRPTQQTHRLVDGARFPVSATARSDLKFPWLADRNPAGRAQPGSPSATRFAEGDPDGSIASASTTWDKWALELDFRIHLERMGERRAS